MKLKQIVLVTAIAGALAAGMSGEAMADVYAGSSLPFRNLTLTFGDNAVVSGLTYTFTIQNTAVLNGSPDPNSGTYNTCNNIVPTPCGTSPAPVLNADAANGPGGTQTRANTNYDFIGPGSGESFANSNSQITTAELVTGSPTSGLQVSESELAGSGTGSSTTVTQSTTQFQMAFSLGDTTSLTLDFQADPSLRVLINTALATAFSAQASTDAKFTLTGDNGVSITWAPDGTTGVGSGNGGLTACAGGATCTVNADDENLVNTISLPATTNPNNVEFSYNGNTRVWSDYNAVFDALPAGNYSLAFSTGTSTNVTQAVAVPEPGILALFGIGLAGMGMRRRAGRRT